MTLNINELTIGQAKEAYECEYADDNHDYLYLN